MLAVRSMRGAGDVVAWTGIDNVPVVLHANEPPRASWAAITALAARLAGPDVILPRDPRRRAQMMGLIEMVAGEDGLGWLARHAMIEASVEHDRGFPQPVGQYLAKRYSGSADRTLIATQLDVLRDVLAEQHELGNTYFGGGRPMALDIYVATFLTPLSEITEACCPKLSPKLRAAFATAREAFGQLVSPTLFDHRERMLKQHLGFPIEL